jgi:hypothetical protein
LKRSATGTPAALDHVGAIALERVRDVVVAKPEQDLDEPVGERFTNSLNRG